MHCLANAGCELIKLYAKKSRGKAILSTAKRRNADFTKLQLRRQYWIAFKHATEQGKPDAERDDDGLLDAFLTRKTILLW